MQLLLNLGGPDRVSRVQMAEAVAESRGYDISLINHVSASSVSIRNEIHSVFWLQFPFCIFLGWIYSNRKLNILTLFFFPSNCQ